MRLGRGTQLVVRNRFLHTFLDRAVQRFLKQAVLVHFLDEVCGDLARTEAGHPHLRGDFLHLRIDARFDIAGRNGKAVGSLQPFILRFLRLHRLNSDPHCAPTGADSLKIRFCRQSG